MGKTKKIQWCRKEKKETLQKYAEVFQERNLNLAVYNMVLHDDEANPHLHINYVPHFSSHGGLTKRVGMDRALQEQGIRCKWKRYGIDCKLESRRNGIYRNIDERTYF
nr:plasmid recombination protein [Bacillus thuringiensis]